MGAEMERLNDKEKIKKLRSIVILISAWLDSGKLIIHDGRYTKSLKSDINEALKDTEE